MHRLVSFLVFVFAIGTVRMNAIDLEYSAIPDDCFFTGYICSTDGLEELPGTFNTPEECYLACKAKDDGGETCNYWTYRKAHGKATCYNGAEGTCVEETPGCVPSSADNANCASGPSQCAEAEDPCTKLESADDHRNKVIWSCHPLSNPALNPYIDDIPSGTTCFAECAGWKDPVTPTNHQVSSTCTKGVWSALDPAGVTDANDVALAFASPEEAPNPDCLCKDIRVKWEHPEQGMELFCTDANGEGDLTKQNLAEGMDLTGRKRCISFCDRYLTLDISCSNGDWREEIEDSVIQSCSDIYCWNRPDEAKCSIA